MSMTTPTSEWSDPVLWARIRAGDEDARRDLIEGCYGLVQRICGKMTRSLPRHADPDEIVSYGTLGLLRAVENYNPDSPVHFETYAAASIRSLVLDELRVVDWAPRSLRRRQRVIDAATSTLTHELGRPPTDGEVAENIGVARTEVTATRQHTVASYHRSLDEGDPERDWGVSGLDDPGSEQHVDSDRARRAKALALAELREMPVLDQAVIALKYYVREPNLTTTELEPLKLRDVAQRLGITEGRASQLHSRAVVRVRDALRRALAESVVN